jgi:hypothetical protein
VAAKRFNLDGVKQIKELQGLGYSEARNALPNVCDRFFAEKCEPFVSIYK